MRHMELPQEQVVDYAYKIARLSAFNCLSGILTINFIKWLVHILNQAQYGSSHASCDWNFKHVDSVAPQAINATVSLPSPSPSLCACPPSFPRSFLNAPPLPFQVMWWSCDLPQNTSLLEDPPVICQRSHTNRPPDPLLSLCHLRPEWLW